jgi:hypothetical protein
MGYGIKKVVNNYMMQLETDPKIIAQAESQIAPQGTQAPASSMVLETDPKIIAQAESQIAPQGTQALQQSSDDEGVPFLNMAVGAASAAIDPFIGAANYMANKVLPSSMQPNFSPIENLPLINQVVNPQSAAYRTGELAPLVSGLGEAGLAGAGAVGRALTPVKQVSNTVSDYVSGLVGDTPLKAIPSKIAENIRTAFGKVSDQNTANYANVTDMANKAGFNADQTPSSALTQYLSGNSSPTGNIIKTQTSLPGLEDIAGNDAVSKSLRSSISDFMVNPSYKNAHELQNLMGNEGSDFLNIDNPLKDKGLGDQILNTRNNLVGDITSSFENAGHPDIAKAYTDAAAYFKNNMLPYRQVNYLKNIVDGQKTPSTLVPNLMSDDVRVGSVLDQLNQYAPNSSNLMTANMLAQKSGLKNDLNGDIVVNKVGNIQDNLNGLQELYNKGSTNLKNNLTKILTPPGDVNHLQNLSNILDSYQQAQKIKGRLQVASGIGAAAGLWHTFGLGNLLSTTGKIASAE